MSITYVTITGNFPNATCQDASITFTPTADLTDVTDAEFVAMVPDPVDLSVSGTFSQALISNLANPQIQPGGWMWQAIITVGQRSGEFSFNLAATPNPVDITALMPAGWQL